MPASRGPVGPEPVLLGVAAGDPAVYTSLDGKIHVVYRGLDQHIHDLQQD